MRKLGIIILILMLIFSISFGGTGTINTSRRLEPPSFEAPFGRDSLGRSIFERTAGGIGMSIYIAAVSTLLSVGLGIVFSYLYTLQHFPKEVFLSISDSMKAVPSIILALFIASISGPGIFKLSIVISLSHIADVSRTAYSRSMILSQDEFIEAERSIGAKNNRIFFCVMLPHIMPYLSFQGASIFLSAVIAESTLSFLGCGIPAPIPSIGSILSEARPVMLQAPWTILFPSFALLLLGVSIELIAMSFSEPDSSSKGSH